MRLDDVNSAGKDRYVDFDVHDRHRTIQDDQSTQVSNGMINQNSYIITRTHVWLTENVGFIALEIEKKRSYVARR